MVDYHMHTIASPDAEMTLDEAIQQAKKIGLSHIAITNHQDYFNEEKYKQDETLKAWQISNVKEHSEAIEIAKIKNPEIQIAKGIEIGQIPEAKEAVSLFLDEFNPDFVITSLHLVNDVDPYCHEYFENKTRDEAYIEYLKCTIKNIDYMDKRTCVIGHIGYPCRYAKYENREMIYEDYPEIFDVLLKKIIDFGFGIEINVSNFSKGFNYSMPAPSLVKRYKELGGEIITIGSDAHTTSNIGKDYERAKKIAIDAGFKYQCVYNKLKKEFIKL